MSVEGGEFNRDDCIAQAETELDAMNCLSPEEEARLSAEADAARVKRTQEEAAEEADAKNA